MLQKQRRVHGHRENCIILGTELLRHDNRILVFLVLFSFWAHENVLGKRGWAFGLPLGSHVSSLGRSSMTCLFIFLLLFAIFAMHACLDTNMPLFIF